MSARNPSHPAWWYAGSPCPICGKPTAHKAEMCSRKCGTTMAARRRDPEVEKERRRKISIRMRVVRMEIPNPMDDPEVRQRMTETIRARGQRPKVRGGNGTGPTVPEMALFEALARRCGPRLWHLEYIDSNGQGSRARGLPTHYKIDLAAPSWRVAIEVDGPSHAPIARQEQDRRKDEVLASRGWLVLRFTNREVMADPDAVADIIVEARSMKEQS